MASTSSLSSPLATLPIRASVSIAPPSTAPVDEKVPIEAKPQTPQRPIIGTTVRLSVPLDAAETRRAAYGERKLLRRDSLERRESLLKGKEGSRARRRWENDRLLGNPHAEPPLPQDWEVRPTYPRRTVPYYLAPLWDAAEFQRAIEASASGRRGSVRRRSKKHAGMSPMEEEAVAVATVVKERLKKARCAKGLLKDLEEEVRLFVRRWNERELRMREPGRGNDDDGDVTIDEDEEDEEIVFVGRNGSMHDSPPARKEAKEDGVLSEMSVFEAREDDKGAGFARWLVHCVGAYYGLRTWSVTKDGRREAFVGVEERARGFMGRGRELGREIELPRPLWGMV